MGAARAGGAACRRTQLRRRLQRQFSNAPAYQSFDGAFAATDQSGCHGWVDRSADCRRCGFLCAVSLRQQRDALYSVRQRGGAAMRDPARLGPAAKCGWASFPVATDVSSGHTRCADDSVRNSRRDCTGRRLADQSETAPSAAHSWWNGLVLCPARICGAALGHPRVDQRFCRPADGA